MGYTRTQTLASDHERMHEAARPKGPAQCLRLAHAQTSQGRSDVHEDTDGRSATHEYTRITPDQQTEGASVNETLPWFARVRVERPVMILPQVHLRKPCYDFSFL